MRWILVAVLLLAVRAGADEVILRGGGKLRGEIEEETDAQIVLRMPSGTMVLDRARVARVVRERKDAYLHREARARLRSGSTAKAIELYERALRLNAGDREARAGLADALAAHAKQQLTHFRVARARATVDRLEEFDPHHGAVADLRATLAQEKVRTRTLAGRAQLLFKQGKHKEALAALSSWRLRQPAGDRSAARELATTSARRRASARAGTRRRRSTCCDPSRRSRRWSLAATTRRGGSSARWSGTTRSRASRGSWRRSRSSSTAT
ncbi:MAG: tetratricopeptide repeat protein [Planctomycetota bacterium]|jgi:tetratricopeptide (TPR) repeat protein